MTTTAPRYTDPGQPGAPILPGGGPYGGTTPFAKGSSTSHAAALAVLPRVGTKRRVVLDFVRSSGGATNDEVVVGAEMLLQSVCARMRELVLLDLVVDSGRTRLSRAGKGAKVWVAK